MAFDSFAPAFQAWRTPMPHPPPPAPLTPLPALYIWLLIGMTLDPFAPALVPILGQPLQAGMDQPFLAGSIREFWGCR